tara:strand:- start:150 stop:383 length:234 start_codon:yes stop_codon:yes gene_type:complete
MVATPKGVIDLEIRGNMNATQRAVAGLTSMMRFQDLKTLASVIIAAPNLNLNKSADHQERRRAKRAKKENHVSRTFA